MGDVPTEEYGNKTPLESAFTPKMDNLANTGQTGLMHSIGKGIAPQSDAAVISILGYDPFKYSPGRGVLESIGIGIDIKDGDLILRCNYATLGQNKKIIDRRVGRDLPKKEAEKLNQSIKKKLKFESHPADFKLKTTVGYRAVLVIRSKTGPLSSKITNTDPAYTRIDELSIAEKKFQMKIIECKPMDKTNEAKTSASLVNEFIEKSTQILNNHEVNQQRELNQKLKANLILTRDAGTKLPQFFNIEEKYGFRFACLADMPVERGIAKPAGMRLVDLPPPSGNLKKDCQIRAKILLDTLSKYDCFYIHIKGPDEPGHDGNFELKKQQIEIIDEHFFGEILKKIDVENNLFCITADHATPCYLKAHSDDAVPLLISGNKIKSDKTKEFSEKECQEGNLGLIKKGTELIPLLMDIMKNNKSDPKLI